MKIISALFVLLSFYFAGFSQTQSQTTSVKVQIVEITLNPDMLPSSILMNLKSGGFCVYKAFKINRNGQAIYRVLAVNGSQNYQIFYDNFGNMIGSPKNI